MDNENTVDTPVETGITEAFDSPVSSDTKEPTPQAEVPKVEKPSRTPEEELSYFEGRAQRLRKQLGVNQEKDEKTSKKSKSSDIDWGQLAFHNTKPNSVKIEADEDVEFLRQTIEDTSKPLDHVLNAKWFQSELKEKQEARKVSEATPKGSKRSAQPANTTEEYWIAKLDSGTAELNDIPDFDLRSRVLNKRVEAMEKVFRPEVKL